MTLRLAIRFPAGHYHATPWGRHVNEGEVEWPASPWRLYRAVLAAGFTKLGWTEVPPDARALIETLAAVTPELYLPAASLGHTRHYMPIAEGRSATTTKVIDAFAAIERDESAVLGVEWDVALSENDLALVDALAAALGYLGRAESWAAMERVSTFPPGLSPCKVSETAPGPGYERVPLLAPLDPATYARWRSDAVARETAAELPKEAAKKKIARLAKSEALYPKDVIAVLLASTKKIQDDGWSQPPGTRWLSYWRGANALTTAPPHVARRVPRGGLRPTTALLALASDTATKEVLPRLEDALWRAERTHAALVRLSDEHGRGPSRCFTGKDDAGEPLSGHRHAMVLPVSLARRGHIDHVLVHALMGLDEAACAALGKIRRMWAKRNEPETFVTLVGLGNVEDFAQLVPHVGSARVWISTTPFVAPRFMKAKGQNSLEGQVQSELSSRGLQAAARVEAQLEGGAYCEGAAFWHAWEKRVPRAVVLAAQAQSHATEPAAQGERGALLAQRWRHFRLERGDKRTPEQRDSGMKRNRPPIAAGIGLRVTFEKPLPGPIALGYGAHFGLGVMRPFSQDEQ